MARTNRLTRYGMPLAAIVAAGAVWVGALWLRPSWSPETPASAHLPDGYIADGACAVCHASITANYDRSGMGQDWRHWSEAAPVEDRSGLSEPRQAGSFLYRVLFPENRQVQREFRLEAEGQEFEVQTREAAYILGSGLAGRGYVASDHGYLAILPLGWYSDSKRWDLNPGYETHNQRFGRRVQQRCMSCHNAMVAYHPGSGNAYVEPLPPGLGCQRCHGPGAQHVAEQERGKTTPSTTPRSGSLINPAKLSLGLQQDVCLQCHLLGDLAIPQPGFDYWGFRPGMSLRAVRSDFLDASQAVAFRAVGHGPRSMASACYEKSGGKMSCLFCHDPHKPSSDFAPEFYNRRCLDCHASQPCTRPLKDDEKAIAGNCVACHMPKRSVADIPHAAATDHWIRRPTPSPPTVEEARAETGQLGLSPFWPGADDGQLGSAYVEYFGATGALDQVERGVALLETALEERPGVAEWEFRLGYGYSLLQQWDRALERLDRALRTRPDLVEARHTRGQILLRLERKKEAISWFEETLARWPRYYEADLILAQLYWEAGQPERLLDMEDRYFQQHPRDAQRLELVARALDRLGRPAEQVEAALDRAIQADGSLASPHLMRAELAIRRGEEQWVAPALRQALRADPESALAQVAWAGFLASQGLREEAVAELQKVLSRDPNDAAARRMLQRLHR